MAKLVVLSEGLAGTSYELKVERTTIGRVEDNAFPIAEASVSGHHCEIILRGPEVVVRDLNSTNGTFINGEQVKEAALKPGQILRLGSIELRLEDGSAPPATSKKQLDHTSVISAGVKLNELEGGTRAVGSPFAKKSNKANKIFLYLGVGLGAVIIVVIIWAIINVK
jgi:pSer/pThr/pTyr-binding forkhead associated (FHA) protein